MVGEPVEQGRGHLGIAEDGRPFGEAEIGCDDHAGALPNYRGSTTIYYSILQEQNCAASAILLANDIDTGPIVASKTYPAPPTNIDIDYIYDSAIRADLLVTVLNNYAEHGELPTPIHQEIEEGQDYYIIHPVLKHLAMLSIGNR